MSADGSNRHPLAPLVDLFVYAPIGAMVLTRDKLPELIRLGRDETNSKFQIARVIGQFAMQYGQREFQRWVTPPQEAAAAEAATAPVVPYMHAVPDAAPSAEDLAVPSYDSLAASQVVARLASLSGDELAAVRDYELATRRRRTILNRIDQLAG